jgi:hypothetical protein
MDDPQVAGNPSTRFGPHAASILATEHWSLLGTRSAEWSEAFSRTTVFLNALSASVIALALVADATGFDDSFNLFALFLFPVVLFLGVTTYVRLVQINEEDIFLVVGMNRLRRAYLDMAPELAPYFTTGVHDDEAGVWATYLMGNPKKPIPMMQFLVTTPTVIATLDAIVASAGLTLLANHLGVSGTRLGFICAVSLIVIWLALFSLQVLGLRRLPRLRKLVRFPTPEAATDEVSRSNA